MNGIVQANGKKPTTIMNDKLSQSGQERLDLALFGVTPAERRDMISGTLDPKGKEILEWKLQFNPDLARKLEEARELVSNGPAIIPMVQQLLKEVRRYIGTPVEGVRGLRNEAGAGAGMKLQALNFTDAGKPGKSFENRTREGVVKAQLDLDSGEFTTLELEASVPAETLQDWEVVVLRRDEGDELVLLTDAVEFHDYGSALRCGASVRLPWTDTMASRREWDDQAIAIQFRLRLSESPPA